MKISEIIALGKLGYTKAEIDAIRAEENAVVPEAEAPAAAQDAEPKAPMNSVSAADLISSINKLTETLHAQNLRNTEIEAPAKESVEDMLIGFFGGSSK